MPIWGRVNEDDNSAIGAGGKKKGKGKKGADKKKDKRKSKKGN